MVHLQYVWFKVVERQVGSPNAPFLWMGQTVFRGWVLLVQDVLWIMFQTYSTSWGGVLGRQLQNLSISFNFIQFQQCVVNKIKLHLHNLYTRVVWFWEHLRKLIGQKKERHKPQAILFVLYLPLSGTTSFEATHFHEEQEQTNMILQRYIYIYTFFLPNVGSYRGISGSSNLSQSFIVYRQELQHSRFAFLALSGVIFRPAVCATSAPCGLVASVLRTDVPRRHASLGAGIFGSPCGKSKQ